MRYIIFFLFCSLIFLNSCQDDDMSGDVDPSDLTDIPYDPVPYNLEVPCEFPEMVIPADNPLEVDGVQLGRFLFYDPILSADSTMSCASCHAPNGSFTDNLAVSVGIDGIAGRRSSMSLLNIGYVYTGLFWDGRVATLEEQALLPVEDEIELHATWPNVINKLKAHDVYPEMFRKAFGISSTNEITKELAAKAIAQFERTLVSSGQSKYDRTLQNDCNPNAAFFTELELEGFELFKNEVANHPGCTHCHTLTNSMFTDFRFVNNGIEDVGPEVDDLNNFPDKGFGEFTGSIFDNGKFRVPSLRNIDVSGPFMHDGRFQTLEEVINHYSSGFHNSANLDSNIAPFDITPEEVTQLVAFLKTLRDDEFMNNPAHQNPF